jgi:hypothetical protein
MTTLIDKFVINGIIYAMTTNFSLRDHVEQLYRMTFIESLDLHDPEALPGIIFGAVKANQRGRRRATELLDRALEPGTRERSMADLLLNLAAAANIHKLSEIAGRTVLSVTALNPESEAILKNGVEPVGSAVGDFRQLAYATYLELSSGRDMDGSPYQIMLADAGTPDFYYVQATDDMERPLVDIKVVEVAART